MHALQAKELYNKNWDKQFTTMEDLYSRIKILAENGACEMCVYIESSSQYNEVYSKLRQEGYVVEHYNEGNSSILEVHF